MVYHRFGPLLTEDKLSLVTGILSFIRKIFLPSLLHFSGQEMIVGLSELPSLAQQMLEGNIRGRYVVDPRI